MKDKPFVMPFGKYQGALLCQIPTTYLQWGILNFDNDDIVFVFETEVMEREYQEKLETQDD
jgi:hypothetical protein|tara:strand:- start:266 stop:448 length:183 start_codon:yes stop_codon:yes gene_type:complete